MCLHLHALRTHVLEHGPSPMCETWSESPHGCAIKRLIHREIVIVHFRVARNFYPTDLIRRRSTVTKVPLQAQKHWRALALRICSELHYVSVCGK